MSAPEGRSTSAPVDSLQHSAVARDYPAAYRRGPPAGQGRRQAARRVGGAEMAAEEETMTTARLGRRSLLRGAAGMAAAAIPLPALAAANPVKIGLLTVKTGPLAQGGIQMEQGTTLYLKDNGYTMAGRKVELVVGDTGGNPAGAKTKAQELIERDNVDMIFGPLAAFELLAISEYVASHKTPILSLAAAEDMSQRKPNPYFVRASGTAAQNMHPLADYTAKELKYRTVITISEDFAFG